MKITKSPASRKRRSSTNRKTRLTALIGSALLMTTLGVSPPGTTQAGNVPDGGVTWTF